MADGAGNRPSRMAGAGNATGSPGYDALLAGAMLLDRSDRGRWRFTGPNAAETLNGLVTNDVLALKQGHGLYAAALTAKGRIVADLRILHDADGHLADTGPAAAAGWRAMARKFINPRVAPFTEITELTRDIGLFGARSAELLSRLFDGAECAFDQLRPYAHVRVPFGGEYEATVVRAAELGEIPGFDVIVPAKIADDLNERFLQLGAVTGSIEAFDVARIEAGFPAWGVDMSEDTLAQEANLDDLGAISYSKGCYVGQEVVARIHFRGHVNRSLRRITFDPGELPPRGAVLSDENEKTVGDVRSSTISPRLGGLGIAMIRREVAVGARVVARWNESSTNVMVR